MCFPVPLPVGCRGFGKRKREVAAAGCRGDRVWGSGDAENSPGIAQPRLLPLHAFAVGEVRPGWTDLTVEQDIFRQRSKSVVGLRTPY